jgi:predicted transposase YbfD/YdcC
MPKTLSIQEHFRELRDPRGGNALRHPLINIVVIAVCAVICGANEWTDVEEFGHTHHEWLGQFLDLAHGTRSASHDTFGRVFARLDPQAFERCLESWVHSVVHSLHGQHVALDGKTLRNSHDSFRGQEAIHTVSAWLVGADLTLGHLKVEADSNEIPTVREVLSWLDLHGCGVTADAMHCQTETARLIVERGGEYVLPVKDNQPTLRQRLEETFAYETLRGFKGVKHSTFQHKEKGHGRVETRRYTVIHDPSYLQEINADGRWWQLGSVIRVERIREIDAVARQEVHYYISSLATPARALASLIRNHWRIENGLHWRLDVVLHEDLSRVRVDHGPENFALLRRLALNLLKRETTHKHGIQAKRLKAAWDANYLLQVLEAVWV